MSGVLLFCVYEGGETVLRHQVCCSSLSDKVQFTRTVLNAINFLCLVERRANATNGTHLRRSLGDEEKLGTEFVGASKQDCQSWALQRQAHDKALIGGLIAVVDERSLEDDTVLMMDYNPPDNGIPFGRYGVLPKNPRQWADFRVHILKVTQLQRALK